jgi:hypothetical protein
MTGAESIREICIVFICPPGGTLSWPSAMPQIMLAANQRVRRLEVRWEVALITGGDALNRGAPSRRSIARKSSASKSWPDDRIVAHI